jgi:hypothetical protein
MTITPPTKENIMRALVTPEVLYDVAAAICRQVGPIDLVWQDEEAEALLLEADMLAAEADSLYDLLSPPLTP